MKALRTWIALAASLYGCSVPVAKLTVVAPDPLTEARAESAVSQGWRDGESCRLWVLGISGLPQVDEAVRDAMQPVHGAYMRDVTVLSVHPVYGLFGWHCYHVRGEVMG